jgi:leader peptidase (prepilin peptidase)/N-methyltransferase
MITVILIYGILSLIIGDILSFIIYQLSKIYSNNNSTTYAIKINRALFKEYITYIIAELHNNKKRFIIYSLTIYILVAAITFFMIKTFGLNGKGISALILCYSLICLTYIDIKTQYLPDIITKPLILIGLLQAYLGYFANFKESIIGAIAGYAILWTINFIFKLIRKTDGMGYGDFKLLAAIGAWVGYIYLPLIILLSSFIGIIAAILISKISETSMQAPSPFGPSLAIACIISLVWGASIVNWYFTLYM